MNLVTMDYFVALAEEKSFTRAAERLHVTQQTLSAHIAQTERELGSRLVNRKVPLTLTFAGERFLEYARSFQATRRVMDQEFADLAKDERGLLGIGIAATRGHMLMPEALSIFQEAHPGIDAEIIEEENRELIELLREGRVDVVVATVPENLPGFTVRHLYDEEIVLFVAKSLLEKVFASEEDPEAAQKEALSLAVKGDLSGLSKLPFMMLGEGDEPGEMARMLIARSGFKPWVRVRSTNSETLIDLAARGVGACFVPLRLVDEMFKKGEDDGMLAISLGEASSIAIDVAWRDDEHVWSVIESFYKLLDELYSER